MGLFTRGKNREDLARENAVTLESLAASVDVLIEMTNDDGVREALAKIQEELRYSAPSLKADVRKLETKIENKLGDMKIYLTSKPDSPKVKQTLEDLRLLIVERSSKC